MLRTQVLKAFALALLILAISPACMRTEDHMNGESGAASAGRLPDEGDFPSLSGANEWVNSPALTTEALRGKVVLVSFWTYTCINWLRVEPYLDAWAKKYKDKGLVVIGVHTPEFKFEKDISNVRRFTSELEVSYPVAVDTDYRIWNAFDNRYWPAMYFIDAQGRIRHHQFGEGGYEASEKVIQQLLTDAGQSNVPSTLVEVTGTGAKAPADWNNLRSPENYLGYERTDGFASPEGMTRGRSSTYSLPTSFTLNEWALSGEWLMSKSDSRSETSNSVLETRFHARDVHLVMGPADGMTPVRFRVSIDGNPPGASHGADVDENGIGTMNAPRMYQLIRQLGPVQDRQFRIEFLDGGAAVYAFTFG